MNTAFLCSLVMLAAAPPDSPLVEAAARLEPVELKADQVIYEPSREVVQAHGHAVLSSPRVVIHADDLTYDQTAQRAVARGNVTLVSGLFAAVAEEIDVDLISIEADLKGGLALQKKNVSPQRLASIASPEELKQVGDNAVSIRGNSIRRTGENQLSVEGLSFTPCDCNALKPSWRLDAVSADVIPGERAILSWPVVYIHSVPVFAFPWLYLPLSDRRTGLLVPKPAGTADSGFSLEQPFFLTLGPSYDFTFTPGYYFGGGPVSYAVPSGDPSAPTATVSAQRPYGIKGPRLHTEFRYAPSEHTSGRATLGLVYDLMKVRDPVMPEAIDARSGATLIGDRPRGVRGEFSWQHDQQLGGGWHDHLDLAAVSDGYYVRDLSSDILLRENQYLRSTAALFQRGDDHYLGLDLSLRQDLRAGFSLFGQDRRYSESGQPLVQGPRTFQRLPGVRFAIPDRPLFGPVFGRFTAEYTRLAPLFSRFGDEGADGLFYTSADRLRGDLDGTQGDGQFQPGERVARDRFDLRPMVSAGLRLGDAAVFSPYLGWREDVYFDELGRGAYHRGYPIGGFQLGTELSRTFGPAAALRHAIAPQVELRYVPKVFGATGLRAYDEIDAAVRPQGLLQALVEVNQRLTLREGAATRDVLRLDLAQAVDLMGTGRLGDSTARLGLSLGPFTLEALGRYNFPQHRTTQISASAGYDGGPLAIYARIDHLPTDGADRMRAGLDELFGPPSALPACDPAVPVVDPATQSCRQDAELLVVGGHYRFGFGLGLSYEALVQRLKTLNPGEPGYNLIAQQSAGISYSPSCDCWRLEARATFRPLAPPSYALGFPDFGITLTLARFGTFGAGR